MNPNIILKSCLLSHISNYWKSRLFSLETFQPSLFELWWLEVILTFPFNLPKWYRGTTAGRLLGSVSWKPLAMWPKGELFALSMPSIITTIVLDFETADCFISLDHVLIRWRFIHNGLNLLSRRQELCFRPQYY